MDGQILLYRYAGSATPSPISSEPCIYVNGMNTTPQTHADTAAHFAELTRHDVIGCYNLLGDEATLVINRGLAMLRDEVRQARQRLGRVSGAFNAASRELISVGARIAPYVPTVGVAAFAAGVETRALSPDNLLAALDSVLAAAALAGRAADFLLDLEQCAQDWLTPLVKSGVLGSARALDALAPALPPDLRLLYLFGQVITSEGHVRVAARSAFAGALLQDNAASENLFGLLYDVQAKGTVVHIICHSQGNLIVSNVLNLLSWVFDAAPRARFHVFGLASPANPDAWPRMPGRLKLRLYYNAADPVTWLSLHNTAWGRVEKTDAVVEEFGQNDKAGFGAHDIGVYERESTVVADLKGEFRVLR
jgi:hypothetical protein